MDGIQKSSAGSSCLSKKRSRSGSVEDSVNSCFLSRNEATQQARRLGFNSQQRLSWQRISEVNSPPFVQENKRRALEKSIDEQGQLKSAKIFNDAHRADMPGMDEWVSTALTRELLKGMLDGVDYWQLSPQAKEQFEGSYFAVSSIRSPTTATGFALKDKAMQHPANREWSMFADPYATASLHSRYDQARRDYILRGARAAWEKGEDVIVQAMKSSIEFTLNYMMAPARASNVRPFMKNPQRTQPLLEHELDEQMAVREHFKTEYQKLGGRLRRLPKGEKETRQKAIERPWSTGEKYAQQDFRVEAEVRAPSPFRR
ncbi:hypothetical protein [Dickeya oryzae]|uniref:hypothetical protein n=1 Tax=Dickeya oryzae TaxID=1240404 RepID=UPI001AEC9CE7|nr:hypothetical protein [Dickeya oryzae]MBP2847807.1 hypothetical protein [Dickeya oryzae]